MRFEDLRSTEAINEPILWPVRFDYFHLSKSSRFPIAAAFVDICCVSRLFAFGVNH